jgi:TetR/AcrR family transcriptional regulator of autoinduction and epiphytic fitness
MTDNPPSKRKYDSSRRQALAQETRHLIAESARGLFFERGYSGTTIDAIAETAGVAPETVYATFGSKRKILSHLMDISIGGDEQPIRLIDRPEPQAVLHDMDQHRQIMLFSRGITEILVRSARLFEIMRSAAKTEPDIENLVQTMLKERLENMTTFVQHLASHGRLRDELDLSQTAEWVWTLTSPEIFLLLTRDRGYSAGQYSGWLQATLTRLILP